jgi:cytochrome c oxidase cbb3-type subunit 3
LPPQSELIIIAREKRRAAETMRIKKIKRSVFSAGISTGFASLFCLMAIASAVLWAQIQSAAPPSEVNADRQAQAKVLYESACAPCHGLDAGGGERGPDIMSRPEVTHKTDAELAEILKDGRTSAGMPAFSSFGTEQLSALIAYLRVLQGQSKQTPLPGDATRGKTLFYGRAKCAECHLVSGQGGFLAPDLTSYAARKGADEVRTKIVNPDKNLDPRRGIVDVVLRDSAKLSGVVRNEDNFSLQLQTQDGVFHLLNKSDIRTQTYAERSGLPANYGSTLSAAELNDNVSYMLRVSGSENRQKPGKNVEDHDE